MAQQQLQQEPPQTTSQHWEKGVFIAHGAISFSAVKSFVSRFIHPDGLPHPFILLLIGVALLGVGTSACVFLRQRRLALLLHGLSTLTVVFLLGITLWSFFVRGNIPLAVLGFPLVLLLWQLGILWFLTLRERST